MKPLLVIPMTGISARFTAAGYDRPKFLLETDGQLVIDHVVDMYPGWDDVVFICNGLHLDDPRFDLEAHLLRRRPGAVVVRVDGPGLGPGDAVLRAADHIPADRPVVVNYCDFAAYQDSDLLAERLGSGEVDGVIPCYTGRHPHMAHSTSYAYVRMAGDRVLDIQEKQPWTDDPLSEFASSGTYGFASGRLLLDSLRQQVEEEHLLKGEYYLSLTYKPLLARGGRVEVLELQHFMQWGTPQDFEEYREASRAVAAWTGPRVLPSDRLTAPSARVLLASGAGQRFRDAGYDLPKPALPLSGRPVLDHALAGLPGGDTVLVTRRDLADHGVVATLAEQVGARLVSLPGLTQGQAESALRGLEAVADDVPVSVGACDALPTISQDAFDRALAAAGPDGLVVWLARPYHAAARKPGQYGWAAVDDAGLVTASWLKAAPEDPSAGVMIGTFTFGSRDGGRRHIESLMADDERINGEFYLDSLVRRVAAAGLPVVGLVVETFSSVGTPAEYEALRYWQSCFHKWVHHPYALAADPMVAPADRARLDAGFRTFRRASTAEPAALVP
ncbi:NTP transferase domain-containing protein [Blastococcus sp. SYSU D00669]